MADVSNQAYHHDQEKSICLPFWQDGVVPVTDSTASQIRTENLCEELYLEFFSSADDQVPRMPELRKRSLAKFLLHGFQRLPTSYASLDSSHPWLCFWIINGVRILGEPIPPSAEKMAISVLRACQTVAGGFGGGPGQIAHLASTYAACMALCSVGTSEALSVIDRVGIRDYMRKMHLPSGAFMMSEDGEEDSRACYCAAAVAVLLNFSKEEMDTIFEFTAEWLVECQTYEGGFGALPGAEAHGGYTYCSFTTLYLLDKPFVCDLDQLVRWLSFRQMRYEGGFQGRTNKLVDSCYTFWQGAAFPLLQQVITSRPGYKDVSVENSWFFDRMALQQYVLVCCQNTDGGISDKPEKGSDYYHTCYALAGISVAQHDPVFGCDHVLGSNDNRLEEIHPAFNITTECLLNARQYFKSRSFGSR